MALSVQDLNDRKRLLLKKMELSDNISEFAGDWLALETDYEILDSKANAHFCNVQYKKCLGIKIGPLLPDVELPRDKFDWQKRKDH